MTLNFLSVLVLFIVVDVAAQRWINVGSPAPLFGTQIKTTVLDGTFAIDTSKAVNDTLLFRISDVHMSRGLTEKDLCYEWWAFNDTWTGAPTAAITCG